MLRKLGLVLGACLVFTACGDDSDDPDGSAGAGGAAGASGGSGTGGSGGASAGLPSGLVETCFGERCPRGECDNEEVFSDVACTAVYPEPIGGSSDYCGGGGDGGYCLIVQTSQGERSWLVTCTNGSPSARECAIGCSASGDSAACE